MSAKALDELLIEMGGFGKGLGEAAIQVHFGILSQFHGPRGSMIGSAHEGGWKGKDAEGWERKLRWIYVQRD